MDATSVGRKCQALVMGVMHKKRLLPLSWLVYEGVKGHAKAEVHILALQRLQAIIPETSDVVLVTDAEYDNIKVLNGLETNTNWGYAIRTTKNVRIQYGSKENWYEEKLENVLLVEKDELVSMEGVQCTRQNYGSVMVVGTWDSKYEEPIYLVNNLDCALLVEKSYLRRCIR